eukprot:jgi/Ulvmu1/730/UM010_0102.1
MTECLRGQYAFLVGTLHAARLGSLATAMAQRADQSVYRTHECASQRIGLTIISSMGQHRPLAQCFLQSQEGNDHDQELFRHTLIIHRAGRHSYACPNYVIYVWNEGAFMP